MFSKFKVSIEWEEVLSFLCNDGDRTLGFSVVLDDKKGAKAFFLCGWVSMHGHNAHQWPVAGG